jgi:lipid A 3-O-deacylase
VKSRPFPMMCLLILGVPAKASAIDSMSVEYGVAESSKCELMLDRIGVQKNWDRQWFRGDSWHVGGYWDLSLGYWRNNSADKTNEEITDIGFTPTFRFEKNQPSGFSPYIEGAVGLHGLSHASVSIHRRFGCAFAFGDHIGFGMRFGPRNALDLSYRFQHLSNAGIKPPNQGINYDQIRFSVHF